MLFEVLVTARCSGSAVSGCRLGVLFGVLARARFCLQRVLGGMKCGVPARVFFFLNFFWGGGGLVMGAGAFWQDSNRSSIGHAVWGAGAD